MEFTYNKMKKCLECWELGIADYIVFKKYEPVLLGYIKFNKSEKTYMFLPVDGLISIDYRDLRSIIAKIDHLRAKCKLRGK